MVFLAKMARIFIGVGILLEIGAVLTLVFPSEAGLVLPVILFVVGGIMTGLGVVLYGMARRYQQRRELVTTGLPTPTRIHEVVEDTSMRFNGRHPFRIVTIWEDEANEGPTYFQSEPLTEDPQPLLDELQIEEVVVYRDPKLEGVYFMDLRFLTGEEEPHTAHAS